MLLFSMQPRNTTLPALLRPLSSRLVQALRKVRLGPDVRTFPIHNVNGNSDHEGKASENRGSILNGSPGNVLVEGCGVHGRYTSQEVASKIIATGC